MAVSKTLLFGILSVIGGTLVHFTFGHFYTIANMVPYIMSYVKARVNPDVDDGLAIWLSALALGAQGITMPLGGITARRFGFRWVVASSCLLVSGGVLLTYFTITRSFVGVMITYALVVGSGLGFGYSVVLAVASTWFPASRGLVVGIIVGGFGLGALVFTPIQTAFVNPDNVKVDNVTRKFTDPEVLDRVPTVFLLMGGILLGLQIIGFLLLRPRPEDRSAEEAAAAAQEGKKGNPQSVITHEENVNAFDEETKPLRTSPADGQGQLGPQCEDEKGPWSAPPPGKEQAPSVEINVTPKRLLRRIDFYLLWFVMFCNIIPITIITSAYKMFGQRYISDDRFLSAVVTISSLFNCGGRIVWGALVDRLSFKIPLGLMLGLWATFLISFPHLSHLEGTTLKVLYALWVCILFVCISGVFSMMPAATSNLFGPKYMAINYGLVFNAFVAGSLLCAVITTLVRMKDGYIFQFTGCGIVCLIALMVLIWIEDRKMSPRMNFCRVCTSTCKTVRITPDDDVEMTARL
ncbi:unnamed protein product [Calicophoron daubneyi]|uniref:Oxalate:formate antiporter n=1 Tax=Calicophoron daubneyi TaxID=300641 RepID=A0AAV2T871_CALDB